MSAIVPTDAASRWQARPGLARLVRAVALLAPIVASTVTVFMLSRVVERPAGLWPQVAWWAGSLLAGSLAMLASERLARRLLPLAVLLRLSLVFPDAAPPRFGLALRRGSLRNLQGDPTASPTTPGEVAAEMARLVTELSAHDRRTRGHTERVRAYSVLLGEQLRLDRHDADRLQWAALLHDVGKLSVPAALLNKPGKLDDEEFAIVRGHPAAAEALLEPLRGWLGDWVGAAAQHHERYDGGGYPRGLAGTEISLAGRIVAVADAYDVMTSARSYKKPQDPAEARAELTRCAGTHFDPVVVRAFLNISLGGLRRVLGPVSWLTNVPVLGTVSSAPIGSVGATVASTSVATGVSVAAATILPALATVIGIQLPGTHASAGAPGALLARTAEVEATAPARSSSTVPSRSTGTVLVTPPPNDAVRGADGSTATTSPLTEDTTTSSSMLSPTTTRPTPSIQATTTAPARTTSTTQPASTTTASTPPSPPPGTTSTTTTTTTVPGPPAPPPGTTSTSTTGPTTSTTSSTTTTTTTSSTTTTTTTTTTVPTTTTGSTTTTTVPTTTTTVPTTTTTTTTTTVPTTTTGSTTTTTVPTTTTTAPSAPVAVDDSWSSASLSHNGTQNLFVLANDSGSAIRVVSLVVTSKIAVFGDADVEIHNSDVRFRPTGSFWGLLVFEYTIEDSLGRQATAQGTISLL